MDDKMVYDLLKEVRDEQREQGKSLSRMEFDISNIKVDVKRNTDDLILHMAQTQTVKELHAQNEKRIELNEKHLYGAVGVADDDGLIGKVSKLEEPSNFKAYLYKHSMKVFKIIAAAGAAFGVVSKYFGWW